MKIVIPGGSGRVGRALSAAFSARGDDVLVLTRSPSRCASRAGVRHAAWDGRSLGPWAGEIDGADAVINLAGRDVDCRYSPANLREMFDSRVDSTRVVGDAIAAASRPPRVWLQASTATIYSHHTEREHDDVTGVVGGREPDLPQRWVPSIEIAKAWEQALDRAPTPHTRRVALRTAIVMSPDSGGPFATMLRLVRCGLGGAWGSGHQYVSWIHERDFVRSVDWLIADEGVSGPVNLAAPGPLPQRAFVRALRAAAGARISLPATEWMIALGTWFLGSEAELVLKSRRAVPRKLLDAGFRFEFDDWATAAQDLVGARVETRGTRSPVPPDRRALSLCSAP